ncbi:WW domain protein [Aphelenchoides besseyi]|nr:WW domain protein [Aphelenchoides besseyi]KAI6210008.1 WW domain protein [Aphelenchoides besseyi]
MLNKSHQQSTPTFLQGTTGLYQRRNSPPLVPGTVPKVANAQFTASVGAANAFHAQYYHNKSNPGSSTQIHAVNSNTVAHQQPFPSFFGQVPRPSASSTSLPLAANNGIVGLNSTSACVPHYTQQTKSNAPGSPQRRLSHTPRGNRTVSTRGELSSHSFSSPRQIQTNVVPTPQQQQVLLRQNQLLATSSPHFIQNPQTNSSQPKFQRASDTPRRALTASLSYGNVVQFDSQQQQIHQLQQQLRQKRNTPIRRHESALVAQTSTETMMGGNQRPMGSYQRATSGGSLQSLTALQQQQMILRKHDPNSPATSHSTSAILSEINDIPLPPNWDVDITPEGYRYYVDHKNCRTTWNHPLAVESLPPGWTKIFDQVHGVVYFNEVERRSQFEHPGTINRKKQIPQPPQISQRQSSPRHSSAQSSALAAKIRESASMQSILQHQQKTQQQQIQQSNIQPREQFQRQHQPHHRSQPPPSFQPMPQHYYQTDIGSLNIITEDVPDWLRMYGEAPPQTDHLLNWDLFKLSDLKNFDEMLRKLYKQEVINTVSKYEHARMQINGELLRRFQRS